MLVLCLRPQLCPAADRFNRQFG